MKTPDELTQLFRTNGRKVTAQRQCIFRVLQGDVTHPSAEAVFEAKLGIPLEGEVGEREQEAGGEKVRGHGPRGNAEPPGDERLVGLVWRNTNV